MTKLRGVSFLAAQHKDFPAKRAFNKVFCDIENPALAFLWGTFGIRTDIIKRFYRCAENGVLQVYISNEVGRRKNTLYKGEFKRRWSVHKYNQKLEKMSFLTKRAIHRRVRRIVRACEPHMQGGDVLLLCTGLEDNMTNKAARNLVEAIREITPHEIVRNPVGNNPQQSRAGADYLELHDAKPGVVLHRAGVWSNDGVDIDYGQPRPLPNHVSASSMRTALRQSRTINGARYLWIAEQQGLYGDSAHAGRPRSRRIRVTNQSLDLINSLLKEI